VRFFVAVTDDAWFKYLADLNPDEVNFWRPSGRGFGAIDVGAPFLFKLHSPLDYIVGGGFFVKAEQLPLSLAWDAFGEKNGAPSLPRLWELIQAHRQGSEPDPVIGCVILNEPFFFTEDKWIDIPPDWRPNIVVGKSYETGEATGQRLWRQVEARLPSSMPADERAEDDRAREHRPLYGREYLARSRLGQGAFRILVTDAYRRRCAVTGERTLPVLQAAHVKPITESGPNHTDNGLLLRSDLHILFDRGYMTVTPDHRVEVSLRIKEEFDNGEEYAHLHGRKLAVLPQLGDERPKREYLDWHNENVFRG